MAKPALQATPRTATAAAAIPPQYDAAARPVGLMPGPSSVHQWPGAQTEPVSYIPQNQTGSIMATGAPNTNPVPGEHPAMHDPAMLQAAQLLIPGDYQATRKYANVWYLEVTLIDKFSNTLSSGGSQSLSRIHPFLGLDWIASRVASK
jgi:hypothetical protein